LPDSSIHVLYQKYSNYCRRSINTGFLAVSITWSKSRAPPLNTRILSQSQCMVEFTAKHGKFTEVSVDYNDRQANTTQIESYLMSRKLHTITDWENLLPPFLFTDRDNIVTVSPGRAMNKLFGTASYEPSAYA
jgi:hypothetical protein